MEEGGGAATRSRMASLVGSMISLAVGTYVLAIIVLVCAFCWYARRPN